MPWNFPRKGTLARLGALALVLAAIVTLFTSGLSNDIDRDHVQNLLTESGPWGPLLYVAAFALLEPFGMPGVVFIVPASFAWPLWLAGLLSWAGSVGAGVIGFGFARWIGRDWVEGRLPKKLRAYDERLTQRGLATVIVVRLLFFLAPPAHWALGLSHVRFGPLLLGTAIGFAPGIASLTLLGPGAWEVWKRIERPEWLIAGLFAVVALLLGRRLYLSAHGSAQ